MPSETQPELTKRRPAAKARGTASDPVVVEPRHTLQERREESEQEMLCAGTQLIALNGVAATTLAEIGVAAGYNRSLPFYAFKSKHSFLGALLKSMETWFESTLELVLMGKTGMDAIEALVGAHLDGVKRNPVAVSALYAIYVESMYGEPEIRSDVDTFTAKRRRGFLAQLREEKKLGQIECGDLEEIAALLLGMVRGMMIEHLMSNRSLDVEIIRTSMIQFIRAMRSTPAEAEALVTQKPGRSARLGEICAQHRS